MDEKTLSNEMKKATSLLGIDDKILFDFPVRKFNVYRQDILELLVKENNEFQPDLIFTPCTKDIHQDHETLTNEAIRAFKCCTIYGYELPWNLLELPSSAFFVLEKEDVDAKVAAILAYESQQYRAYSNEAYIRSLATTRGVRIKVSFAEAFEAIRVINK
jgi:LmbE family N-acetylglucosaminyl deacetylase